MLIISYGIRNTSSQDPGEAYFMKDLKWNSNTMHLFIAKYKG